MNKNYYAIIPANVRYDEELTPNSKLLYGEITALCNEKGYCWASNDYFAELYKTTNRTVSRWIQQLIKRGYIKSKLIYREGTKEIKERHIYLGHIDIDKDVSTYGQKCHEPMDKDVSTYGQKCHEPMDKNVQDNNTFNNTPNNTFNNRLIDREYSPNKIKEFKTLYEQNIGFINGITAEYLIELSETIEVGVFKKALIIATDNGSCNHSYVKAIIRNWLDKNITTLEQVEAYELQKKLLKQRGNKNGISSSNIKPVTTEIPVDDEKDEEYYRLLEHCRRISEEI